MKTLRPYAAWARKSGTNDQYVTTILKAPNAKEAEKMLKEQGLELDGKPYRSKTKIN